VEAPNISLLIVLMKWKTTIIRETIKRARLTTKRAKDTWEKLTKRTKDSSSEMDEKITTVAIHKPSSTPRLFNNMFDDDYYSPHICLMEKDEKVKLKSKPLPLVTHLVVI